MSREASYTDLFLPNFDGDPFPLLHQLREEEPVYYVPGMKTWLVTRYSDIRRLFTAPEATPDPRYWEFYVPPPEGSFRRRVSDRGLFALPPDEHARRRGQ